MSYWEELIDIVMFPEEPILSKFERSLLLPKNVFFAKYRCENNLMQYFENYTWSPGETCVKLLRTFNFKFRFCDFGICENIVKFPSLYCDQHRICAKESCSESKQKYCLYCDLHARLEFKYICRRCNERYHIPLYNNISEAHFCD